jgi:hypothetical protein
MDKSNQPEEEELSSKRNITLRNVDSYSLIKLKMLALVKGGITLGEAFDEAIECAFELQIGQYGGVLMDDMWDAAEKALKAEDEKKRAKKKLQGEKKGKNKKKS